MRPHPSPAAALLALSLVFAVLGPGPALAQDRAVKLTSLDWPPYTGENLKGQCASAEVVKAAFQAMGYTAVVEFFPWSRAVEQARKNKAFVGYFPEYFAASVEESFIFSEKIGDSPLGFVERVSAPVAWNTLADLKGLPIGTVQDYVNTEAFDRMAAAGELRVEPVIDDLTNVRKVLAGRLRLAVIDRNVLDYLLSTVPDLAAGKTALQFNTRPLEDKEIYVCFRKGPQGEKIAGIFNAGLKMIDAEKIEGEALRGIVGP